MRFFTPTTEVPICGHATIGANYAWAVENNLASQTIIQETGAGNLPIDILKRDNSYQITMTQGKISVNDPLNETVQAQILKALGITEKQRNLKFPMVIASTGAPKVMIALDNQTTLNSLKPDLEKLKAITAEINCNGYYVFVFTPEQVHLVHGRMFSPANGINEDPVTGNANGPLGAYLIKYNLVETQGNIFEFSIMQGEKIHRPGTMLVRVNLNHGEPVKIQIIGDAVIAFYTNIYL